MVLVREFEFYPSEDQVIAKPCDMEGSVSAANMHDAIVAACDWLYKTALDDLANLRITPGGELDHEPCFGGKVMPIAVDCDLSRADAVSAADAARMLDVSPARVAQMCETKQLLSWKEGGRRMVLRSSVSARLAEGPRPGRPRKAPKDDVLDSMNRT